MAIDNTRSIFLTPEELPVEVYPYRRVWRAMFLEMGVMLGLVLVVLIGVQAGFLRDVPSQNWGLLLVLVPLSVFLSVSVRGEQRVRYPREGLLTVALFSALLANGVGVPLVNNVLEPRLWLSDAGFFSRALGYMCTYGVTSEFLKYVAIRYTVFPRRIRNRMDGIAYSIAASVGYASVVNLHVVFANEPTVTADAVRIAINFVSQVSFGVIMGYFLAEVALHERNWFFLAGGLFIGSFVHGVYIAFRAVAAGSGVNVQNVRGLLLVIFFAMLVTAMVNFIVATLDAREAALAGVRQV